MCLLINLLCSSSFARLGSPLGISRSQSLIQFTRRMSTETSGTVHSGSTGSPIIDGLVAGPWDTKNRIRVVASTFGVIGVVGMLFDTFYRRVTKQELNLAMEKLDAKIEKIDIKIDREMGKIDTKIDGLTNALLHINQRDKIAAETENRELRREIERLKESKPL